MNENTEIIKTVGNRRSIRCPVCNQIIDTWAGTSCIHLRKIFIRNNKEYVAIFSPKT